MHVLSFASLRSFIDYVYWMCRVLPLHDSHKILSIRLTAWQKEMTGVIEWYQREHDNFHSVDGTMSKWWVGEKSKQIAFESVRATQTYMDRTYQGQIELQVIFR